MSQSKEQARRNARQHIAVGGAMLAASTAGDVAANSAFRRSGAPGFWSAARKRKLSGVHARHAGAKVAINATRLASLPLIGYGLRNEVKPDKYVRRFDAKRDVVEAQINRWTNKEPAAKAEAFTEKDQRALQRRKKVGRKLSETAGTLGVTALALRAPQGAKAVLRRMPKAAGNKHVAELARMEPHATGLSNNLGVVAIGTGSMGSFNYAAQQKLEAKQAKAVQAQLKQVAAKAARQGELFDASGLPRRNVGGYAVVQYPTGRRFKAPITGPSDGQSTEVRDPRAGRVRINDKLIKLRLRKADDTFLRRYRQNISPSAERGYTDLRGMRNREAGMAAGNAVLGGVVGADAIRRARVKGGSKLGTAVMGTWAGMQGLQTAYNAGNAKRLQGRMNKIKAKGMERAAEGKLGPNREPASKSLVNVPGKGVMMLPASQVPKKWLRRAPKHKSLVGMTDADRKHGEIVQSTLSAAREAVETGNPIGNFMGPRVRPDKTKKIKGRTVYQARSPVPSSQAGTIPVPPKPGQGQRGAAALVISGSGKPLFAPKGMMREFRRHEFEHTKHRKPLSTFVRHSRNPRSLMGEEARADAGMKPKFRRYSDYSAAANMTNNRSRAHNAFLLRTNYGKVNPAMGKVKAGHLDRYAEVQDTLQRKGIAKGLFPIPRINYTRKIGSGLRTPRPRTGGLRRTPTGGVGSFRGSLPGTSRRRTA